MIFVDTTLCTGMVTLWIELLSCMKLVKWKYSLEIMANCYSTGDFEYKKLIKVIILFVWMMSKA